MHVQKERSISGVQAGASDGVALASLCSFNALSQVHSQDDPAENASASRLISTVLRPKTEGSRQHGGRALGGGGSVEGALTEEEGVRRAPRVADPLPTRHWQQ